MIESILHKDPQYAPLTAPDTISGYSEGVEGFGGGGGEEGVHLAHGLGEGEEEVHLARGLAR